MVQRFRGTLALIAAAAAVVGLLAACSDDGNGTEAGAVHGTVKDRTKTAIAGALVQAGERSTQTDVGGNFSFTDLALGPLVLKASADWYQSREENVTVGTGDPLSVTFELEEMPLKLDPADQALAVSYGKSFDWKRDRLSITVVQQPTRVAIDNAFYHHNPAFYQDTANLPPLAPTPQPQLATDGGHNFDFPLEGGRQALVAATIVDSIDKTPLPATARASWLTWDAMITFLTMWDPAKSATLYAAGQAVRQQTWGKTSSVDVQWIERVYIDQGELWVEVVFQKLLQLGSEITDSDGDGLREVLAKLDPAHYTKEILDQLNTGYIQPRLRTIELRQALETARSVLYTRSQPVIQSPTGKPFSTPSSGTLRYPFAVVKHLSRQVLNVLLVAP